MDHSFSSSLDMARHTLAATFNDWGNLHPLIVHVPIALLFVAPLLIMAGLISRKAAKMFYPGALILLLTATLGVFLAVSTGDKASELIHPNPDVAATLDAHVRLAEKIRFNFSVLALLFAAYVLSSPFLNNKFSPKIHRLAVTSFLAIYAYNLVFLVGTAHLGGRLVHHHGITSKLYTWPQAIK